MWLITAILTAVCAAAQGPLTWTNPIVVPLRDPQILRVDNTYYATGTSPPFFEQIGQAPGVELWKSDDLLHWASQRLIVKPSATHWYK